MIKKLEQLDILRSQHADFKKQRLDLECLRQILKDDDYRERMGICLDTITYFVLPPVFSHYIAGFILDNIDKEIKKFEKLSLDKTIEIDAMLK